MGFVNQNGRPSQQMPALFSSTVEPPTSQRHSYDSTNLHHSNVGHVRYIQPSCMHISFSHSLNLKFNLGRINNFVLVLFIYFQTYEGDTPKHTDEDSWVSASSSLHLFFNVSSVQAQTHQGFQLYVIGAKLRLHKYAEVSNNFIFFFSFSNSVVFLKEGICRINWRIGGIETRIRSYITTISFYRPNGYSFRRGKDSNFRSQLHTTP